MNFIKCFILFAIAVTLSACTNSSPFKNDTQWDGLWDIQIAQTNPVLSSGRYYIDTSTLDDRCFLVGNADDCPVVYEGYRAKGGRFHFTVNDDNEKYIIGIDFGLAGIYGKASSGDGCITLDDKKNSRNVSDIKLQRIG